MAKKSKLSKAPHSMKEDAKPRAVEKTSRRHKVDDSAVKSSAMATFQLLKPLAKEINARLEKAKQADQKADDHRLSAALLLADAKKKCVEYKITFKKWFADNIDGSYRYGLDLAQIGAAENPPLALLEYREKGAKRQKRHADKKKGPSADVTIARTPEQALAHAAIEALNLMNDEEALNLIKNKAQALGMQVASPNQPDLPKAKAIRIKDLPGRMRIDFAAMYAADKVPFLKWACTEIGAKLDMSLDMAEDIEILTDIPASMQRS